MSLSTSFTPSGGLTIATCECSGLRYWALPRCRAVSARYIIAMY